MQFADMDSEIVAMAKRFMLAYMHRRRTARPTDFDREILGLERHDGLTLVSTRGRLVWNETPFCKALAELVDAGKIDAREDADGWWYELPVTGTEN